MRLAYIGIRVSGLDGSLKFYVSLLGLNVVSRGKMNRGDIYVLLEDKAAAGAELVP
ncbi:MAG: hypothetical protein JRN39_00645 [Nitrososphaerota archaeon]|nr:hypothetical protein [Nitrososphaerota archaeon]